MKKLAALSATLVVVGVVCMVLSARSHFGLLCMLLGTMLWGVAVAVWMPTDGRGPG